MDTDTSSTWSGRAKLVLVGFTVIGAVLLLAEHRAHVLPFLPWLILAACPLMHIFMHGGHGHGGHTEDGDEASSRTEQQGPSGGRHQHEHGSTPS